MKMRWLMFPPAVCLFLNLQAFAAPTPQHDSAAEPAHHHDATEELGVVSLPTSCAPAVQKSFERGVALLHSFWYEESEKQFKAVTAQDPQCAMAHWGLAMSLYHPLWEHPSAETLAQGRAALAQAAAIGAKTAREQGYITALATFYRDTPQADYQARANAYAAAMEQLYLQHPEDREAGIFYALSLLGSEPPRDTGLANRKKAAAILEEIFAEVPEHPGVAHYLIHTYDTPSMAPLGLSAARRYAQIAPSSPHALHMPSHIFTRLGLWQDSIDSNLASIAATRKTVAMHMGGASHQFHSMNFLEYAYLQNGHEADAAKLIEELQGMKGMGSDPLYNAAEFSARYDLELHHWKDAAALALPAAGKATSGDRMVNSWARAIGAARSGNLPEARAEVHALKSIQTSRPSQKKYAAGDISVELHEAQAWLAYAEGNKDDAVKKMRSAADEEDAEGTEDLTIPAREMLADLLLDAGQPAKALEEYEASLKSAPNRFNGLYGAARAAELSGNAKLSSSYYQQLLQVAGNSDSQRPELAKARTLMARK